MEAEVVRRSRSESDKRACVQGATRRVFFLCVQDATRRVFSLCVRGDAESGYIFVYVNVQFQLLSEQNRFKKENAPSVAFFQVVVEKGWQGVTYVMLDRLEACGVKYAAAVEVSRRRNVVCVFVMRLGQCSPGKTKHVRLSVC